jgi:ABC-type multidrug transport system fused ATPase/permease subunit
MPISSGDSGSSLLSGASTPPCARQQSSSSSSSSSGVVDISVRGIVRSFIAQHTALSAGLLALTLASPIESVVSPVLIGLLSDSLAKSNTAAAIRYIAAIGVVFVVIVAVYNAELGVNQAVSGKLAAHIEDQLMQHFFATHEVGTSAVEASDVAVNIRIYTESMGCFLEAMRNVIVPDILSLLMQSLYVFMLIDVGLGAGIFAIFAITLGTLYAARMKNPKESIAAYTAEAAVYEHVADTLDNFATVVAEAGGVDRELAELAERGDEMAAARLAAAKASIRFTLLPYVALLGVAGLYLTRYYRIFLRGRTLTRGDTDFQKPVTAVVILFSALKTCRSMLYHAYEVTDAGARMDSSRASFEGCAAAAAVAAGPPPAPRLGTMPHRVVSPSSRLPAVAFDRVSLAYGGRRVFEDASFSIRAGSVTLLSGANGCGKTTILRLIMQLAKPDAGEVLVFGVPLSSVTPVAARSAVSYAQQSPVLFNRSILDNICYRGSREKPFPPEAAMAAIAKMGLSDFFASAFGSAGVAAMAGRGGKALSGGQRQIVQLVRIALRDAPIVLLDEVTSAVDASHKRVILDTIREHFSGKTLIMVSHDADMQATATDVLDVSKISVACRRRERA